MTQVELGSELGLSNRTINRWEAAGDEPGGYALLSLLRLAGHPIDLNVPAVVQPPPSGRITKLSEAIQRTERRLDDLETRVRALTLYHEDTQRMLRLVMAALAVEDDAGLAETRDRGRRMTRTLEALRRQPDARTRASDERAREG